MISSSCGVKRVNNGTPTEQRRTDRLQKSVCGATSRCAFEHVLQQKGLHRDRLTGRDEQLRGFTPMGVTFELKTERVALFVS